MLDKQLEYDRIYRLRKRLKGIRKRLIMCDDQQFQILKAVNNVLRQIPAKKLAMTSGLDVSKDLLSFKIILEPQKQYVINENREIVQVIDDQWKSVMREKEEKHD